MVGSKILDLPVVVVGRAPLRKKLDQLFILLSTILPTTLKEFSCHGNTTLINNTGSPKWGPRAGLDWRNDKGLIRVDKVCSFDRFCNPRVAFDMDWRVVVLVPQFFEIFSFQSNDDVRLFNVVARIATVFLWSIR